jgi:hypothetical protein
VEGRTIPTDATRARLEAAAGVLNDLGGLAELEEQNGTLVIRGYGCPLAAVTLDHPEVCRLAEALVAEVAGVPVHDRCDRSEKLAAASRSRKPMTLAKDSRARWQISGAASDRSGGQVCPPREEPRASPSQEPPTNSPMSFSAACQAKSFRQ